MCRQRLHFASDIFLQALEVLEWESCGEWQEQLFLGLWVQRVACHCVSVQSIWTVVLCQDLCSIKNSTSHILLVVYHKRSPGPFPGKILIPGMKIRLEGGSCLGDLEWQWGAHDELALWEKTEIESEFFFSVAVNFIVSSFLLNFPPIGSETSVVFTEQSLEG